MRPRRVAAEEKRGGGENPKPQQPHQQPQQQVENQEMEKSKETQRKGKFVALCCAVLLYFIISFFRFLFSSSSFSPPEAFEISQTAGQRGPLDFLENLSIYLIALNIFLLIFSVFYVFHVFSFFSFFPLGGAGKFRRLDEEEKNDEKQGKQGNSTLKKNNGLSAIKNLAATLKSAGASTKRSGYSRAPAKEGFAMVDFPLSSDDDEELGGSGGVHLVAVENFFDGEDEVKFDPQEKKKIPMENQRKKENKKFGQEKPLMAQINQSSLFSITSPRTGASPLSPEAHELEMLQMLGLRASQKEPQQTGKSQKAKKFSASAVPKLAGPPQQRKSLEQNIPLPPVLMPSKILQRPASLEEPAVGQTRPAEEKTTTTIENPLPEPIVVEVFSSQPPAPSSEQFSPGPSEVSQPASVPPAEFLVSPLRLDSLENLPVSDFLFDSE